MSKNSRLALALAALTAAPSLLHAGSFTGPSSSQAPYLVAVPGSPAFDVYSILTIGDTIGAYPFAGVPDGLGAFSNGDGTMTILVNHEFGSGTTGGTHLFGPSGSFVSRWVVNTTPGPNFLKVTGGRDLDDSVVTTTVGAGTLNTFARFCSADLAAATAFYNPTTGAGTQNRIFLNGEESGNAGRVMAHVVNVNGANTGIGFQLNAFDFLGSWENQLAHPNAGNELGNSTIVMANSDGGTRNGVYAYVGTKQSSGNDIQKAGLTNGTTYSVIVSVGGTNVDAENRQFALATSGSAVLTGRFSLNPVTRNADGTVSGGNNATTFLRPEDGAWDPLHPRDYYFVTTDQYDQVKDATGSIVGRSRLWRMRYDSITNPTAGGTIEALLDGTESIQMLDNICLVPGADGHTRILALEDVGGNAHNGKIWLYDATTDGLTIVAKHFGSNGDIGVSATSPFNNDEEFSGIIDARDTLGLGWFILDDQQHYGLASPLIEGGQMTAIYMPAAAGVPEPASLAIAGLGVVTLLGRRRRKFA